MDQQVPLTNPSAEYLGRFALSPPRHFVLPALLLLLSEEPGYGYQLVKGLSAFRFGTIDRPTVYRGLAQLEKDGLVESWSAESKAGTARRVYGLTVDGQRALRIWMGVMKEERDGLDRVLRRYRATGTTDAVLATAEAGVVPFATPEPAPEHRSRRAGAERADRRQRADRARPCRRDLPRRRGHVGRRLARSRDPARSGPAVRAPRRAVGAADRSAVVRRTDHLRRDRAQGLGRGAHLRRGRQLRPRNARAPRSSGRGAAIRQPSLRRGAASPRRRSPLPRGDPRSRRVRSRRRHRPVQPRRSHRLPRRHQDDQRWGECHDAVRRRPPRERRAGVRHPRLWHRRPPRCSCCGSTRQCPCDCRSKPSWHGDAPPRVRPTVRGRMLRCSGKVRS